MALAQETKESIQKLFRDYGGAIFLAVLVSWVIRSFGIEAYRIPSSSMRPTLEPGDTVFVAKYPFGFRNPWNGNRVSKGRAPDLGEVVVFSAPSDPDRDTLKRVVGIAGDRIKVQGGRVFRNGVDQSVQAQVAAGACGKEKAGTVTFEVCHEPPLLEVSEEVVVPEGQVFVLGDLRSRPSDPLTFHSSGLVPVANMKGRAMWIWISIEPSTQGGSGTGFSRIRFDRMLRKLEARG
ncbi:MAG: signal peptidase I [Bdellovibrionales bacterium]|nr:signal peptidase I [Bdellovibrionales bacterium]